MNNFMIIAYQLTGVDYCILEHQLSKLLFLTLQILPTHLLPTLADPPDLLILAGLFEDPQALGL